LYLLLCLQLVRLDSGARGIPDSSFTSSAQTPSLNPQIQQNLLNLLHSQALAGYTSMYNNNPGVYQAMLLNYAALFPVIGLLSVLLWVDVLISMDYRLSYQQ
jgi:hypothetical protein